MRGINAPTAKPGGVSVVIPTKNRPEFLRATVDSVLRQTRPVEQIVVVDDGSEAADWLPSIAALSSTIEVVRCIPAGGLAAARNAGLRCATGQYLVLLDDDDLLAPRFVEQGLLALAANPNADGVFFRYQIIVSDGPGQASHPTSANHAISFIRSENPVHRNTLEARPVTAFMRYLIPIHSGFLRRSALGDACFSKSLPQGEDTHFWISLAAAGRRFVLDEHPYALIRRHTGNMTRSSFRYVREIKPCYRMLLAEGLLTDPDDAYLAHFKLFWFGVLTGGQGVAPHLRHVVSSPRRLAHELSFWAANILSRIGLWRGSMSKARAHGSVG
jgi:glycosyltransferase involved in cell wall biosynthesis